MTTISQDVCSVILSVSTPGKLKSMPDHGGNRTCDLWNANPMLCQLSYAVRSVRVCDISELSLVPKLSINLRCNHMVLCYFHRF